MAWCRDSQANLGSRRDGGVSGLLEPAQKRRKLVPGASQDREQVVDEPGHDAGMCAEHEYQAYYDDPSDCLAHGYRSRQPTCIPLPAAKRVPTSTARCSLLPRFAVAPETRLVQVTYAQAPSAGMPAADRSHAGQERRDGRWRLDAHIAAGQ